MRHGTRRSSLLYRLVGRWIGLTFDLTGLAIHEGEVLLDLATGRD